VLFCCLWRNVKASSHKHFVVFFSNQHRRLLPATCDNLQDGGRGPPATVFTLACCSVNTGSQARYRLRIVISAYPTCIRRPPLGGRFPSEHCYAVWHGKTRMVWLPDSEKILKISSFVLTWSTNVTDTQTDGQTDTAWRLRSRLHSIARQKQSSSYRSWVLNSFSERYVVNA